MRFIARALILFYIIGFTAAPSMAEELRIWAIGDCHKINPITGQDFNPFVPKDIAKKNYLWDSSTNTVTLNGARNEYVSFQIIIEAKNRDLEGVSISFSDLTGPASISKENVKLFKEHYTNVWKKSDWPQPVTGLGEYPDALIPFEIPKFGAPFLIAKNRNQAVWVDLYIPKDVIAGEYLGNFSVSVGEKKIKDTKVLLAVLDFTLPDKNHLIAWSNYYLLRQAYGLQEGDPRYMKIEESLWKLTHKHRLNALLRHAPIAPEEKFSRERGLYFDFQHYAERLNSYLKGSLFEDKMPPDIFLLPLSGGTEYRWPRKTDLDETSDSNFIFACKEVASYFKEMGWPLDRSYVYISDEPGLEGLDKIIYDAKLIHNANKNLKTMVALSKVFNETTLQKLSGSADMWLIDAAHYNSKLLTPRKKMGERIGFYQQGEPWCGNENLDSDGLGFVTWPWIAWKYNVDCIYLYSMTEWAGLEPGHTVWDYPHNKSWSNSQGVLLYNGNYVGIDDVIGSIRLKQIRRGMQDYEYMYLAKEKGANPDMIVNSIIIRALDEAKRPEGTYGEWSHNPEDWNDARRNLAKLILGETPSPAKAIIIPRAEGSANKPSAKSTIKSKLKKILLYLAKKLE